VAGFHLDMRPGQKGGSLLGRAGLAEASRAGRFAAGGCFTSPDQRHGVTSASHPGGLDAAGCQRRHSGFAFPSPEGSPAAF